MAVLIHPAAQIAANPTFVTNPPANFNPNADQVIYLEVDHLNTPRIGRDQSGKKVWSWESDAFGSTLANEDPDNDGNKVIINLRFPGQQFDQESGLHYNHHRYYDPQLGRYTNSDPSGLEGGLNNFGYANANSLKYNDPLGLKAGDFTEPPNEPILVCENKPKRPNPDLPAPPCSDHPCLCKHQEQEKNCYSLPINIRGACLHIAYANLIQCTGI